GAIPHQISRSWSPIQTLVRVSAGKSAHVQGRNPRRGARTGDHDVVACRDAGGRCDGESMGSSGYEIIEDRNGFTSRWIRDASYLNQCAPPGPGGDVGRVSAAAQNDPAGANRKTATHAVSSGLEEEGAAKAMA